MRGVRGVRGGSGAGGARRLLPGAVAVVVGLTIGLVVVLLVRGLTPFGGGGGGGGTVASIAPTGAAARVTDPAPVLAPSVLAATPGVPPPAPTAAGVAAALAKPLRAPALGPRVGMVVLDPATGQTLFAQNPLQRQTPASTLKTVTASSALHFIGPDAVLRTRTVTGAAPGDVVLVGGGDPTITVDGGPIDGLAGYPRVASLDGLARQTASALKAKGTSRIHLVLDDSYFTGPRTGPGWLPSDLRTGLVAPVSALTLDEDRVSLGSNARYPDPTAATGRAFVTALSRYGVRVATTSRGVAPSGAAPLGSVSSPPVSALVERMLLESDDDLAEALAHVAGVAAGTGGSFAGGAAASNETLAWLGVEATGSTIVDGSGISRRNALDAALLAGVVDGATSTARPELASLLSGLPVAGVTGTLAARFDLPSTRLGRGLVRAKTGTLLGVQGLAGTVLDRDGRTLVFVVLADHSSLDTAAARAALDRVATALGACGCG